MNRQLEQLTVFLPPRLAGTLRFYGESNASAPIEEVRMHRNAPLWLSAGGKILRTAVLCTDLEFEQTLEKLCDQSLYSRLPTMREGYLVQKNGLRIGVCGKAVTEEGKITAISHITALHLRVIAEIPGAAKALYQHLRKENFRQSILLYAPPGIGKTTLLRELALQLTEGDLPQRVAVIDPRFEFSTPRLMQAPLDLLQGYPMAKGIEIAVRTLSPDYILCDEIGSEADTQAILSQLHAGVPLIASAHGEKLSELLQRPTIGKLHAARVFDGYWQLTRTESVLTKWEEAPC